MFWRFGRLNLRFSVDIFFIFFYFLEGLIMFKITQYVACRQVECICKSIDKIEQELRKWIFETNTPLFSNYIVEFLFRTSGLH